MKEIKRIKDDSDASWLELIYVFRVMYNSNPAIYQVVAGAGAVGILFLILNSFNIQ